VSSSDDGSSSEEEEEEFLVAAAAFACVAALSLRRQHRFVATRRAARTCRPWPPCVHMGWGRLP
jgi:hypothetical protein